MKLEEAIRIKLQWRKDNYPPALPSEMNADMMSIEALKQIQFNRKQLKYPYQPLLPGETKD